MVTMMTAASCSSDRSADVRGLLQTVPADASTVIVADIKTFAEKTGGKTDGDKVTFAEKVSQSVNAYDNENLTGIAELLESGSIDPSAAVFFIEGYNTYLTGYVADSNKFREWGKARYGEDFTKEGDAETCGNTLLNSDRYWICVSSRNTINPQDIKHFTSLSEKQSILINEAVASLEKHDHVFAGWGDIKGCLNALGMDFATRATTGMVIEAVFTDAVEFCWTVDFTKEGMSADINILNTKGGIAKFNFPTSRIDTSVIGNLDCKAYSIAAVGVNPEMIKRLKEETGSKSISVLGMVAGMLSCIDGTCVVAAGEDDALSGVISTTGHGTSDLSQLLHEYSGMEVSMDGKLMRFSSGTTYGPLTAQAAADKLKGAMAGIVISGEKAESKNVETIAVTLHPEKGGLATHINATWKK